MSRDFTENENNAFRVGLESLINTHFRENGSNTPDFILAEYMAGCLDLFDVASRKREKWYGKSLSINGDDNMIGEHAHD